MLYVGLGQFESLRVELGGILENALANIFISNDHGFFILSPRCASQGFQDMKFRITLGNCDFYMFSKGRYSWS